jgi:tetratricopeptide (TPR) repeat protein
VRGRHWGAAHDTQRRYDAAARAYEQACRLDAEEAEWWANLGYARLHEQRYAQALEAYQHAVALDDRHWLWWMNLYVAARKLRRYRLALRAAWRGTKLKVAAEDAARLAQKQANATAHPSQPR